MFLFEGASISASAPTTVFDHNERRDDRHQSHKR